MQNFPGPRGHAHGWHTRGHTAILDERATDRGNATWSARAVRRGRFGAAGASGRTRELGHVLASHLLEPPSLVSGCGEAGLRVRDGRKAAPARARLVAVGNDWRTTRPTRARAASGYSAREAMCAREYATCDLLGQVAFALIVPRARPRAARAAVSVTRLFAGEMTDMTRQLSRGDAAARGTTRGNVEVVVGRLSRRGKSGVRLLTYRYSWGGVACHRAPGLSVSRRAPYLVVGDRCVSPLGKNRWPFYEQIL